MSGRYPFDSLRGGAGAGGGPPPPHGSSGLTNPSVRAALGLAPIDEAMYLQRQQEEMRDFHLRQMALQEQMEQHNRLEMLLQERRMEQQRNSFLQQRPLPGVEFPPSQNPLAAGHAHTAAAVVGLGPGIADPSMDDIRREHMERQARLESLMHDRIHSDQHRQRSFEEQLTDRASMNTLNLPSTDHNTAYRHLQIGDRLQAKTEGELEKRSSIADKLRAQAEEELRRRHQMLVQQGSVQQNHQQEPRKSDEEQEQSDLEESNGLKLPPSIHRALQNTVSGTTEDSETIDNEQEPTSSQAALSLHEIAEKSFVGTAIRKDDSENRQFADLDPDPAAAAAAAASAVGEYQDSKPPAQLKAAPAAGKKQIKSLKRPRADTQESIDPDTGKRKYKKRDTGKTEKAARPRGRPKGVSGKKKEPTSPRPETSKTQSLSPSEHLKKKKKKIRRTEMAVGNDRKRIAPSSPKIMTGRADGIDNDLKTSGDTEKDGIVDTLVNFKHNADWSDSEHEVDPNDSPSPRERHNVVSIDIPNFYSCLPELPAEPEIKLHKPHKKRYGILDDKYEDDADVDESSTGNKKIKAEESTLAEERYPPAPPNLDTWWPPVARVRAERKESKSASKKLVPVGSEKRFKGNLTAIKRRLTKQVQPGVLEKVPHCKLHRMHLEETKNPPTQPQFVQCFQVTELYHSDMMVCCSRCGTWRHACCGGHYKPYSVREAIETPFVAICDRCHAEDMVLEKHPIALKRIDRQRREQIRRGLATTATMRQASFSKYGGTYRWPLGKVSASHIGGHTRSVQARHDKAEKQWIEMAKKLAPGYSQRSKDLTKVRTKELERLLVSVEDAEGFTDRHNMMVFLMADTLQKTPAGYEEEAFNMFDPEHEDEEFDGLDEDEDEDEDEAAESEFHQNLSEKNGGTNEKDPPGASASSTSRTDDAEGESSVEKPPSDAATDDKPEMEETVPSFTAVCRRENCTTQPRYDSVFCSDACGVASAEKDVLRSLFFATDIHPSNLRS